MKAFENYVPAILPITDWEYLKYYSSEIYDHHKSKAIKKKNNQMHLLDCLLKFDDTCSRDGVQNILQENILFEDLSTLTKRDLIMLGFADGVEITNLMKEFTKLPYQNPSYKKICEDATTSIYNEQIFNNCYWHLEALRSALVAIHCKLQTSPPVDNLASEKHFASSLALSTLDQLYRTTDETIQMLVAIEKKTSSLVKNNSTNIAKTTKFNKAINFTTLLLFGTLSTYLFVLFYNKIKFKI